MSKVYVDLLGHKAEVVSIKGRLKNLQTKEDYLAVWFQCDEVEGSTLGFGVRLPVKNYGKEELLKEIKKEGALRLGQIQDEDAWGQAAREAEKKRQEELDSLAGQQQQMITE